MNLDITKQIILNLMNNIFALAEVKMVFIENLIEFFFYIIPKTELFFFFL